MVNTVFFKWLLCTFYMHLRYENTSEFKKKINMHILERKPCCGHCHYL